MIRVRPLVAIAVAVSTALLATAVDAAPGGPPPGGPGGDVAPTEPVRLEVGDWIGEALVEGTATANPGGANFDLEAGFIFDLRITANTQGNLSGNWDVRGFGTLVVTGPGLGTLEQIYGGSGEIVDTGWGFRPSGTFTRTGFVEVNGRVQPIAAAELAVGAEAVIFGSTCEEAWGSLTASWNEEMAEVGWTPSFDGVFNLIATDVEDRRTEDLVPGLNEIIQRDATVVSSMNPGASPDQVLDVWEFLLDALDLSNEIRNLGECAVRHFGADRIETWASVLSLVVARAVITIVGIQEPPVSGWQLAALRDAAVAAGAAGPGALDDVAAEVVDEALRDEAQRILDERLYAEGAELPDGTSCARPAGCVVADVDLLHTLITSDEAGWQLELADGSTASGGDLLRQDLDGFTTLAGEQE